MHEQVIMLDSIAADYKRENPQLSIMLLKAAIRLSTGDHDTVEIQERMNLHRQYRFEGDNDSALMQIDSALHIAHTAGLKEWEGEILSIKGVLYTRIGLYEDATACFVQGMDLAKSINDTETVAMLNKNWAALFFYTTDFDAAIERTQLALITYARMKDTSSMAACIDNIGLYYGNQLKWDSAYRYQLKALAIFESQADSSKLMVCYNNIGSTLMNIGRFEEAKRYLDKSLALAENRKVDYQIMTTLSTMSELHGRTGDRKSEQEAALRVYALALSQENDFYALDAVSTLANSYFGEGNFERSAYYFKITDSLRQIVFDSEKTDAVNDAEEKYKANERKQQIALLEADNQAKSAQAERDQLIKWAISILVIVLLIFSLFIVRGYFRKKRHNVLLHDQNEAIEAQKVMIEVKNEEITDSINYAMRIQNAVLPAHEKLNQLFPENFIYYRPRDIISGDFYWAAESRNGMRYLAVADCTGHGVPGAMMSMLGTSILNRLIARKNVPGPGKMLDALHDELLATLNATKDSRHVSDGMDIVLLMLDPEHKRVVIASADRPVYVMRNNQLEVIDADKISIGSTLPKSNPYTEHELKMDSRLSIYLFSDGITDQFGGPDRKKFMSKRLKNLVQENDQLPVEQRKKTFVSAFDQWKYGMEQTDDMTLINIVLQ